MKILGIETSCDETSAAIVNGNGDSVEIEKNVVSSQIKDHAPFGGVVPELAARKHVENIIPVLEASGVARDGAGIDAIAVTYGPGLLPALRIGLDTARMLSVIWKKPIVGVNHLEGHIASVFLPHPQLPNTKYQLPSLPSVCMLVSGGHTELVLMRDWGDYELLGATRDDAAGEAFDKVAKLLELGYPGGPIVSQMAESGNAKAIDFPRAMLKSGDFDFSFSGLKTAVRRYTEEKRYMKRETGNEKRDTDGFINDICASFQEAAVDVLVEKTRRAIEEFMPKSVILAGGVSANKRLREQMQKMASAYKNISFYAPDLSLAGDNAAMIATAGYFLLQKGSKNDPFTLIARPSLKITDK